MAAARRKDPKDIFDVLKATAGEDGTVRFDLYMEAVLYHPTFGYYSRSSERAGRQGDFLTSPEVAPLFGECVAGWIHSVWEQVGSPARFDLLEVGAGRGTFAATILDGLPKSMTPRVHLVERGASPRRALQERFASDARVKVFERLDDVPARLGAGVFLANELFDNLPVRRLMRADGWKEIHVRARGRKLREELVPAPDDLIKAAGANGVRIDEGQSAEVCEGAVPLLESALGRFATGAFALFDYGGEAHEISGEAAPDGTLAAHRGHARHPDLYANPGEQDVTAHVNFTPLRQAAERLGWRPAMLTTQSRFLIDRGLPDRLVARVEKEADAFEKLKLTQYAKQLYHPESMGEAFRVLYATKRQ